MRGTREQDHVHQRRREEKRKGGRRNGRMKRKARRRPGENSDQGPGHEQAQNRGGGDSNVACDPHVYRMRVAWWVLQGSSVEGESHGCTQPRSGGASGARSILRSRSVSLN